MSQARGARLRKREKMNNKEKQELLEAFTNSGRLQIVGVGFNTVEPNKEEQN
jgi:hypothetical protein